MATDTIIMIDEDGTIRHLVDEPGLEDLGEVTGHYRNSWVGGWDDLPEPAQQWLVDNGHEYDPLPWWADMGPVGGPVLGPFKTRGDALTKEIEWLQEHDLPEPDRR